MVHQLELGCTEPALIAPNFDLALFSSCNYVLLVWTDCQGSDVALLLRDPPELFACDQARHDDCVVHADADEALFIARELDTVG